MSASTSWSARAALILLGETTPRDLPLQLDLLAAYVTDPGFRPEALERYRAQLARALRPACAAPDGALRGPVERLLHDGDPRFGVPPQGVAEQRTLGELRAWLEPMLQHGPLQVVIVGDVDPAQAIAEVGRTFGALPARGPAPGRQPPTLRLPHAAEPVRFTHRGAGRPGAVALVYWPTTGRTDARTGDRPRSRGRHPAATGCCTRSASARAPPTRRKPSARCRWSLPGYRLSGRAIDVAPADAERIAAADPRCRRRHARGRHHRRTSSTERCSRACAQAKRRCRDNDYWLRACWSGMPQFPQRLDDARTVIADHESQTLAAVQTLAHAI